MTKLPEKLCRSTRSVNEQTTVNLYKYEKGISFPLVSSLFSYCFALNLDPGWFIMLACYVEQGVITEFQALEVLANWDQYKLAISMVNHLAMRDIFASLPVTQLE